MSDDDLSLIPELTPQTRTALGFIIVVCSIALIVCLIGGTYNELVNKDLTVEQMKGSVQVSLERRADLVPNLVATIQGSGKFEKSTLESVIAERSQAQKIKENIASAQTVDEIQSQETSLAGVIGRLMLVYEQYPTLKTTDEYKDLMVQLSSTEDQIRIDRNNYNSAVKNYQTVVRSFPSNIIAKMFGFDSSKWKTFTTDSTKQDVPEVSF